MTHPDTVLALGRAALSILQGSGDGGSGDSGDGVGVQDVVKGVEGCSEDAGALCRAVYDWTGNQIAADITEFFVNNVLTIVLIVAVASVLLFVIKRVIRRGMRRVATSTIAVKEQAVARGLSDRAVVEHEQELLRVRQRTDTLGTVMYAIARVFIWTTVLILVLGELGVDLAPLVAGAGIVGVALGFGAQTIVKDFLSGMFMISEDQFGVGDVIDVGEASGTVERITLRTTVLRDVYGTLWHVPNGEVRRVGNMSQHWSMALLDVGVGYGSDVDRASEVLLAAAHEMADDPDWSDAFLDEPEVLGVEALAADAVRIRVSVKTRPARQFDVQRELNRRFKRALEDAGIEIPLPQRTIWVRRDDEVAPDDVGRDDVTGPS